MHGDSFTQKYERNYSCRWSRHTSLLVLGIAYKPNINDICESSALDIIHLLSGKGALVTYTDPHVLTLQDDELSLDGTVFDEATLNSADCVVVATDHADFDWNIVTANAQIIVDTRSAIKNTNQPDTLISLAG